MQLPKMETQTRYEGGMRSFTHVKVEILISVSPEKYCRAFARSVLYIRSEPFFERDAQRSCIVASINDATSRDYGLPEKEETRGIGGISQTESRL